MNPHRDDTKLAVDLRALRPQPRPDFVAELDARAAAGFPKKDRGDSPRGRIASWLDRVPRRRLPVFAGAAATAAIAIATAVVAISEDGPARSPDRHLAGPAAVRPAGRPDVQHSDVPSSTVGQRAARRPGGETGAQLGAGDASVTRSSAAGGTASLRFSAPVPPSTSGPYATRAARRDVERSARIVLGTEASGVRAAAARVFETVHSYDGVVMRSSVRDGSAGQAGAVFDLLIPSGKLGDAMAAFSDIAEVRSRSESTLDVTGPTVGLEERLRDTRATVEGLVSELTAVGSEAERIEVEAELRSARRRLASLRSRVASLQRRTHFSRISLRIETGAAAGGDAGGRWGVDDALDDAGHILTIGAGVTLIGLAILAPFILIGFLIWLAHRRQVRVGRERALE
jgi:hypothetical protein